MTSDWLVLLVVLGSLFVATVIRSAFGFGEALIAVPLLSLVIHVELAAPLAVLASITVALVAVIQDWHKIHLASAGWLFLFTLLGIPLGLWLLAAPEAIVKGILAAIIIAFAAYCLIHRTPVELKNDRMAWLFGIMAGVLGGAYGMNGPPLVVYGALRRWPAQHFRATLQGYFLPASIVGMAGYWLTDRWTWQVTELYGYAFPVIIAAIFVGRFIHGRLSDNRFLTYIHAGLLVLGLVLLAQSIWQR